MSYFALRAAPLGAASPELVTALFYNFLPVWSPARCPTRGGWRRPSASSTSGWRRSTRRCGGCSARRCSAPRPLRRQPTMAREAALAAPHRRACPGSGERRPVVARAAAPRALARPDGAAGAARRRARGRPAHRRAGPGRGAGAVRGRPRDWTCRSCARKRGGLAEEMGRRGEAAGRSGVDHRRRRSTASGRALRAEVEAQTDALADAPLAALGDRRPPGSPSSRSRWCAAIVAGGGFLTATRWACAR